MDATRDSAEVTVEHYDVLADLYDLADPQPKYRGLLERGGALCPADGIAVLVSRDTVETALRDPATFSSDGFLDRGNTRPLSRLSGDPPRHVKDRKIMDPLFAPRRMDEAEADITERFNRFVDTF